MEAELQTQIPGLDHVISEYSMVSAEPFVLPFSFVSNNVCRVT